jgi:hypothetical protein
MIRRSTWVTLGVFALLVVFAVFWTQFRPEDTVDEVPATLEPPWSALPSDIIGVKIENLQSGKSVKLEKKSDGIWIQLSPLQGQADTELVEQSIGWLSAPSINRELTTEGGLAQFGINEPRGIITVELIGGETKVLLIGDVTVPGSMTYVMMPHSSSVLLIDKYVVDSALGLVDAELLLPPLPEEIEVEGTKTSEQ